MKIWYAVAALLWSMLGHAALPTVEGKVTRVTDGDSLWLQPAAPAAPVELRLEGIDAPEICQAWGPEARTALSELVLGKEVSVKTTGRDTHGRTLGTVFLGSQNINKTLVQEGHAWSTRYKYDRGPYVADERMARALSRGFNRDGGAMMPRDFRNLNGPCQAPAAAAPAPAPGPMLAPVAAGSEPATGGRRCDGRTRCSQMTSCAEATWFLKNCPGVEMDGNRDGVPCERQWCKP
ncbi:MAG: thermonuclease family protein [Burkholderiaceae bacterium]|jgi:endonuclease YncB( thermonuclease family)|nr:thermonuclease family protein [Burkholderiaceae bacterium]